MTHSFGPWFRAGLAPVALLALLTACSSEPRPGLRGAGARPPTPMAGWEKFFAGRILAEVKVGTDGVPKGAARDGDDHGGAREGRGGRRGGGGPQGQFGIAGGSGGFGGNIGGSMPFGGGDGPPGGMGGPRPGGMMGGGGRPVMIHLRFTNLGDAPVTLTIDTFTSPLGNFAVRPDKLVLEPGQSLETEPMSSQLAGLFSEVDATLVLRLGMETDKKTFRLQAVKPPAPPEGTAEPQSPNPPKS